MPCCENNTENKRKKLSAEGCACAKNTGAPSSVEDAGAGSCCGKPAADMDASGRHTMSASASALPSGAGCGCGGGTPDRSRQSTAINPVLYFSTAAVLCVVWYAAYSAVLPVARWCTYDMLGLAVQSPLGSAVEFFLYDTAKIFLLLALMVYVIGWLRAGLHVERVRAYLAGKGRRIGYVLGAGFGAITPFCSCSSIPLFLGFTTARIPLGITMAFLITSPLINEIAVVLLWGVLGWKFTVIYVGVGMLAGIVGGIIMDVIHAEHWLQPYLLEAMHGSATRMADIRAGKVPAMSLRERHYFACAETKNIVHKVWLWVVVGVALGAILHGYVPQAWFTEHLGAGQWWSVPVAVVVGIPLYTNVTGIVPVMESLLLKGLPVGTSLAFCMSTVAVSLPEILMLKQVMRWKLLMAFIVMLLVIFTLAGWLFNMPVWQQL